MQKIVASILCLILILSMPVCANAADITGAWYSDTMVLTLKEGGIYTLEKMDEAMIGTWVLEGENLYMDKGTLGETIFNYDAAAQTLRRNNRLFTRAPIADFEPGNPVSASPEAFTGSWTSVYIDSAGVMLTAGEAGFRMEAAIDGSKVALIIRSETEETIEGEAVYTDGVLNLAVPTADGQDPEGMYTISLLDTGLIRIYAEPADEPAVFYLQKADPVV